MTSSKVHPKTTGKQVHKAAEQAAATTSHCKSTRAGQQAQKTRLAVGASASELQGKSSSAEGKVCANSVPDSDDDDMPDATGDVGPLDVQPETMLQSAVVTDEGNAVSSSGQQHGRLPSTISVLLPGGSTRFSTRRLQQKVDAKLPVSKATPVGLPPTPLMPPVPQ